MSQVCVCSIVTIAALAWAASQWPPSRGGSRARSGAGPKRASRRLRIGDSSNRYGELALARRRRAGRQLADADTDDGCSRRAAMVGDDRRDCDLAGGYGSESGAHAVTPGRKKTTAVEAAPATGGSPLELIALGARPRWRLS